jgi:shikimate kinase / 3-dehydroquinate synthase
MAVPIFLIGFAAAGKSTVGRLAAAALGRRFVDLDDVVATGTGRSVAALVAADEPEFRRLEADALTALIADPEVGVVATGGGAATFGDNLERMTRAGLVIALAVDLATAVSRSAPGSRPLLARPHAELVALYRHRAPIYRRAHATINTEGIAIEVVAAAVVELVRRVDGGDRVRPWVCLGPRSYPIVVDDAPLSSLLSPWIGPGRHAVVADRNLKSWTQPVVDAIVRAGARAHVELVEPGEGSKSLATYGDLAERLIVAGLDRTSTIIAIGGGVVGDLAGFVAATLFRGIAIVHVPTTIVAMTDSAIGGKTAIDVAAGKNLLGAFHQPRAVIAHVPTLASLPPRERIAGFGELWKYALLDGEPLWSAVDALAPWAATAAPPPAQAAAVIRAAASLKAAIVSADEHERTGLRLLLNLGHTVGHAIEAAAEWTVLHGEAVALGLVAMARVSRRLGLASPGLEAQIVSALAATGLPTDLTPWLRDDVLARMSVDKKRVAGQVRFVACAGPGDCRVVSVPTADFADLLRP